MFQLKSVQTSHQNSPSLGPLPFFLKIFQDREVLRLLGGRRSAALGDEAGLADEPQAAQCGTSTGRRFNKGRALSPGNIWEPMGFYRGKSSPKALRPKRIQVMFFFFPNWPRNDWLVGSTWNVFLGFLGDWNCAISIWGFPLCVSMCSQWYS